MWFTPSCSFQASRLFAILRLVPPLSATVPKITARKWLAKLARSQRGNCDPAFTGDGIDFVNELTENLVMVYKPMSWTMTP